MISVCFPYRRASGYREENAKWILSRYRSVLPEAEICLGVPDVSRPFNRSEGINNAFRQSSGDVLVIADLDIYFDREMLLRAVDRCTRTGEWGFAFRRYYTSTAAYRDWLVRQNPDIAIDSDAIAYGVCGRQTLSGQVVISREAFLATGGFDEDFVGWGYEDDAFTAVADRLVAPHFRIEEAFVLHLWHPHASLDPNHAMYEERNRQLFQNRYVDTFGPRRYVP